MKIRLRGVNKVRKRLADGSVRIHFYHRATGLKLPSDPESAEFVARLAELNRPDPVDRIDPRSIEALIITYKASPEFKQLAPRTRRDYASYLERLRDHWGRLPVKGVERPHVLALRDKYSETPSVANYLVTVLRLLMSFAMDRGWRKDNPAIRPKRLKTGDGHRPWEEWELEAFSKHWAQNTEERLAFELLLNTGQRGIDVNLMVRNHYRSGRISVVQEKTGARVEIPVSVALRTVLDPWLAEHPNDLLLLPGKRGKGRGVDAFRHWMSEAAVAAGLNDVTTHGLRYTAATRLQELGLDWQTIADITGHETMEMARKYSEKRRRTTLAIAKLDAATGSAQKGIQERDGNERS